MRARARSDAVVVGAGPAGSVAARRLAQGGLRAALVCGGAGSGGGGRGRGFGETLVGAARGLLSELGLWDGFAALGARRCPGTDSAWGSPVLTGVDAVSDPNGAGWHLDRRAFDDWLLAEAEAAGVVVLRGSLQLPSARWLIDASGRRAVVARSFGAARVAADKAVALVAWTAASDASVDGRTLVEAVPGGWWYTAVSPDGRRVVMFVTDRDLVTAGARTLEGFAALLAQTQHVRARVGDGAVVGPVQQVAAGGSRSAPVAGPGWLAVGDAACAFDPLSSQGVFTALYTAMLGADAVLSRDVRGYVARVERIVANYQRNAASFYGLERRWPTAPFWRRRQPSASLAS